MKKAVMVSSFTALLMPILLIGCGSIGTRTYDFTDFTKVEIGSSFRFEVVQSDSYVISITAPETLFSHVQVSKDGDTLRVFQTAGIPPMGTHVKIAMPDLVAAKLSGSVKGSIKGFSSSHDFNLDVSGASNVSGNIVAGDAALQVSGASKVQLEGSAKNIAVNISGASTFNLSGFVVNDAKIMVSGASHAAINVMGRLDADISGASRVSYTGEPTLGNINTSGSSTLTRR
jgi:hypothetical protein